RTSTDPDPRRNGRMPIDRTRAPHSQPLHGTTQSPFAAGMGVAGRNGNGREDARGAGRSMGGGGGLGEVSLSSASFASLRCFFSAPPRRERRRDGGPRGLLGSIDAPADR